MKRLDDLAVLDLPAAVVRPAYDRRAVATGIVHLGLGAFHKAHQAVYYDDALNSGDLRWGVLGASLRSSGVRDQLAPQDNLYTVTVRDGTDQATRLIGALRGVLVAPPQVARSAFVTRFENPVRVMMSGWGLLKNAIYRYGVDHALPLSDHADFDELLELIERVAPRKIYTHHGYREFAETLRGNGLDATCAKPDAQLTLFGE